MMSMTNEPYDDIMMCCASCGVAEVDDINLKTCADCDLVRYCSDECKQEHSPQHEQACKERTAELRDEILFRQPESTHEGDCPICFLPHSIDTDRSILHSCCSKVICLGCAFANLMREHGEGLEHKCPFCRHPVPKTKEEADGKVTANVMKRIVVNDPVAICFKGNRRLKEGDYEGAFEYWTKAAELGDAQAHFQLSVSYGKGIGVERDEKKEWYHLEEAAIGGHIDARYNLALMEVINDRINRAVKHFIIAANLGFGDSIKKLKHHYASGDISKEDFAAALRGHQAAVNATKSPQREAAEAFFQKNGVECLS